MLGERVRESVFLQPASGHENDPYQVAFAKTLAILLIAGPVLIGGILLAAGEPERLLGTLPFAPVGVASALLLRWSRFQLAFQVLVYGIWACAVNALFWTHGLTGTTLGVIVIALAIAGWLSGPVSAIVLTAATPPVLFLLAWLEMSGWPISIGATIPPYQRALVYSFTALGGGALGYFGAASLRERLAKVLRSQQRFETLFRSSPHAAAITEPAGRILDCNQAFEELVGRGREAILGRTTLELGVWDKPEHRQRAYDLIDREGRLSAFETDWLTASGALRTVLIHGEPLELNRDQCILFHLVDITERKRNEEVLRLSERKYAAVFDTAADAIGVTRRHDGTVIEMNVAWEQLSGYPREQVLGRSALDLGVWADPADRGTLLARLDRDGVVANFSSRYARSDGRIIDVLISARNYDISGEPCTIWSWTDISELRQAERKTENSLRRFVTVFENSPDPIVISRLRDGVNLAVNDAWVAASGCPRERAIGRTGAELGLWTEADRAAAFKEFTSRGQLSNKLISFTRADGTNRDVLISAAPIDFDDEPCIMMLGRDVTALRAAERAVVDSELRYRSLFQAASDCILIIDRDGRLVDINDQGSRTLEYSREELLGDSYTRVLDAKSLSRLYPRLAHVLLERRTVRGEQELRSKSGKVHHLEFVAGPLPNGNVLAIARDVTDRKRMEQLLVNIGRGVSAELGEAFFKSLVTHLCTNLEADYAFVGEIIAPENARVRTRAFVVDSEERPNFEYELEGSPCINAITRRGTVAYPKQVADEFPRDAGLKRLGVQGYVGTSLFGADGAPLGILVVMSRRPLENVPLWCSILEIFASRAAAEIERNRAEARVLELNLSLERKVIERTVDLEAANRELEAFSYTVSHDLRAPLRAIAGFSSILRDEYGAVLAGEPTRYFERIERAVHRMGRLIDDLLEFSRTGRAAPVCEKTPMHQLVDVVTEDLRQVWGTGANVLISDLPAASCDPGLIRQVWQNLIGNAFKFSSKVAQPIVEVGGKREGDRVEYWVKDNGAGFDMAYAERLFGVFQRLHGPGEFEGTGIGLATVRRIVQRHGGSVKAEGRPGLGATFRFTLPAA
jgi:PAS domain S-box-containing protein